MMESITAVDYSKLYEEDYCLWLETMTNETITINVSPDIALAYHRATEAQKQRLQMLIGLFFNQNKLNEQDTLGLIMDEISDRAIEQGLTPEILESILHEEL